MVVCEELCASFSPQMMHMVHACQGNLYLFYEIKSSNTDIRIHTNMLYTQTYGAYTCTHLKWIFLQLNCHKAM